MGGGGGGGVLCKVGKEEGMGVEGPTIPCIAAPLCKMDGHVQQEA